MPNSENDSVHEGSFNQPRMVSEKSRDVQLVTGCDFKEQLQCGLFLYCRLVRHCVANLSVVRNVGLCLTSQDVTEKMFSQGKQVSL